MSEGRGCSSTTPLDENRLRISTPKTVAAGIPATVSTIRHSIAKMGVARTIRTLSMVNQKDGFDCPGCAWPDPSDASSFEFCENGAKAVADEATKSRVEAKFLESISVQELASKSDFWLNNQGRLVHPMYLAPGRDHYQRIEWDAAVELITDSLRSSPADRAAFYTSGRTSNEAAFLFQLLARSHGTNNLPDCSNMCHESSGHGLNAAIGIGKGTVSLEDFNHSDLIMVIGQNPGTNHPRMLTALRDAKRKGAKIIHVNPLAEAGLSRFKHPQDYMNLSFGSESLADLHLQVKIGGDAALMHGLMKICIERGAIDAEFIKEHSSGFSQMRDSLKNSKWAQISEDSGLDRDEIEEAGRMCAESKATIACWAMGLTQHKNGVAVIQEVTNLLLLGGHIGRPGAGVCPVRGHSNVQGDRTMGIWERPSEEFLSKMDAGTGITSPRAHGLDVVESIRAMDNGLIDTFVCMGGNFLSATPDTELTASALAKVGLTVQISTKLNRSHLLTGKSALILPCLGRTELDVADNKAQFVSVENSMGVVHTSRGNLKPASDLLRSESWIVCSLAMRLLDDDHCVDWLEHSTNYDSTRDLIAKSIPGFEDYNRRIRAPSGFILPNPPRDERVFKTDNGKANFISHPLPDVKQEKEHYVMMTIRSHDQYNTTIYGLHDRYRGVHGNRRVILMNALDMSARGWKARTRVNITSHFEGSTRVADNWQLVPYNIPRGNIATYFPEANSLIHLGSTAEVSNTPTSKWIICSLESHDSASLEEE
jgi:molybdopterin-dependent oxidoreductase alpha subunit